MAGRVLIGTSGWHYKHWLGVFYPPNFPTDQMLKFFSRHFDTVELNNTFYHLPRPTSFDMWRDSTPSRFVFAAKGSRFITHMKKLKDPETALAKFFYGPERLGKKLGPVLFQLPPRWKVDTERLNEFLQSLPKEHKYVFEFRDKSWLRNEVYEQLRQFNAALCIHDLGGKQTPLEITANFSYVRFHGPGEAKYAGSYSSSSLKTWSKRVRDWRRELKEIYVYFNNDIGGHAVENAKELKELVSS
ncbi:MAG: DUF72 domain-containing protein [Blastocatellia bacterium]|nr:MAG: DUF72 domain-containing protein [Blastocatellia bacterium]